MIILEVVVALGLIFLASKLIDLFIKNRKQRLRIAEQEKARNDVKNMIAVLVADRELAQQFQQQLDEALKEANDDTQIQNLIKDQEFNDG